jgi:hypothetical protein
LHVMGSEICWVGLPSLLLAISLIVWRIARNPNRS